MMSESGLTDEQIQRLTAKPITAAQLRRIWATSRELGMSRDGTYALVYGVAGSQSISALSKDQAAAVITELEERAGRKPRPEDNTSPGRLTVAQMTYIRELEKQLDWQKEPARLNGYCKRVTGCEMVEWLAVMEASDLIVALKKLIAYEKAKGGADDAAEVD